MASALRSGLGFVILSCFACGPTETFDYVGVWRGSREVAVQPGTPEDVRQSLRKVELRIEPSGKFFLYDRATSREGEFARSGGGAQLQVKTLAGQRIERLPEAAIGSRTFEVSPTPNGGLRIIDPGSPNESVTLRREPNGGESQPGG